MLERKIGIATCLLFKIVSPSNSNKPYKPHTGFIYPNCHIHATLKDTKIYAATTVDLYLYSVCDLALHSTPVCPRPLRSLQKNVLQAYALPYVNQYDDCTSFNLRPLVYIHSSESCRYATGLKMSITRMFWLWSWLVIPNLATPKIGPPRTKTATKLVLPGTNLVAEIGPPCQFCPPLQNINCRTTVIIFCIYYTACIIRSYIEHFKIAVLVDTGVCT